MKIGREEEEDEVEEDLGILYCVCKKKYGGELMTGKRKFFFIINFSIKPVMAVENGSIQNV